MSCPSNDPSLQPPIENQFDPHMLQQRALQWRAEAAAAKFDEMRIFCLDEAEKCERRLMALANPPFAGWETKQFSGIS